MVGCGDGNHIDLRKIAKQLPPRPLSRVWLGPISGPGFEICRGSLCGAIRPRGNRCQLKIDSRKIAPPQVKPDPPELRAYPDALQITISAQMHVSAKHAGSHQRDFESL